VAVDLSPDHSRDARAKFTARIPDADLTFLEIDGAKYRPDDPGLPEFTKRLREQKMEYLQYGRSTLG